MGPVHPQNRKFTATPGVSGLGHLQTLPLHLPGEWQWRAYPSVALCTSEGIIDCAGFLVRRGDDPSWSRRTPICVPTRQSSEKFKWHLASLQYVRGCCD